MLKIKENVDLKELEKFKFKPKYNEDTGEIMYYWREYSKYPMFRESKWFSRVEVGTHTRNIEDTRKHRKAKNNREIRLVLGSLSDEFDIIEILFDLIQAGLVEKVY